MAVPEHLQGCTGKRGFESRAAAKAQQKWMIKNGRGRVRIYRCDFCTRFHITSMNNAREENRPTQAR